MAKQLKGDWFIVLHLQLSLEVILCRFLKGFIASVLKYKADLNIMRMHYYESLSDESLLV